MRTYPFAIMASLLLACAVPLEPPARESGLPLQTEGLEYELRSTGQGLEVGIPFSYRNATGQTVYVVNCNRIAPPSLEKEEGGQWIHAWSAVVPDCLSPPIVIEPGQTYTDTLRLFAGHPSNNTYPKFEVGDVDGIYRLVWHQVVHDYDEDRQGFGDPLALEERISNAFVLQEE